MTDHLGGWNTYLPIGLKSTIVLPAIWTHGCAEWGSLTFLTHFHDWHGHKFSAKGLCWVHPCWSSWIPRSCSNNFRARGLRGALEASCGWSDCGEGAWWHWKYQRMAGCKDAQLHATTKIDTKWRQQKVLIFLWRHFLLIMLQEGGSCKDVLIEREQSTRIGFLQ